MTVTLSRGAQRATLIEMGIVLLALFAPAQTSAPSANEKKTTPPVVSPTEEHKESSSARIGVPIEVLSDTMGVDFGPYLNKEVLPNIRQNWYNLIPEMARLPMMKKGKVTIDFAITKDDSVAVCSQLSPPELRSVMSLLRGARHLPTNLQRNIGAK